MKAPLLQLNLRAPDLHPVLKRSSQHTQTTQQNFWNSRGRFRGRGFTIMELLIASVLAAILMIGILFATTQLAKQVQRQKHLVSPTQFSNVLDLLRRDLSQATACRVTENQIHLRGFLLLDGKSQIRTEQPAEVSYRLVEINGASWLIRHQRELSNLTLDDTDANLLCKYITTMQLLAPPPPEVTPVVASPPEVESSDDSLDNQNNPQNKPQNIPPLPTEKDKDKQPFEFTDQWQPLPDVVQWVITQPLETDDALDANTLTFTLVLK
jgi:hypothetical protein